jgi:DNA-binding MarR family transcriptional regulator
MASAEDPPRDTAILLGILSAVERDSKITQRSLSKELGIALGLANGYLRRCIRKGLIKVKHAPLNRYAYYLTPRGFAEKSRLTGEYLAISFKFFRDARRACTDLFTECRSHGCTRLVLAGAGELAEVAVLSAAEANVEIDCIVDPEAESSECAGLPVVGSLAQALARFDGEPLHAVVVTDTAAPQFTYDAVLRAIQTSGLADATVLAPAMLRITRKDKERATREEYVG